MQLTGGDRARVLLGTLLLTGISAMDAKKHIVDCTSLDFGACKLQTSLSVLVEYIY